MTTVEQELAELKTRVVALENHDEALLALIGDRNRLAASVEGLTPTVEGLSALFQQVKSNQERITSAERKTETVEARRARDKQQTRRRLLGVLVGLLLLVTLGTVNFIRSSQISARLDEAKAILLQANEIARKQCVERNAGLMVTIERERALAKTDVEATRQAHANSADKYQKLIQNCDAIHSPANR